MAGLSRRGGDTDGSVGALRGWLARYGAMSPPQALRLVAQLCAELGAAHKQGLVHGAVDPGCVLLHTGRDGTLVGHLRDATGDVGQVRGYTAPERHHEPTVTSRGDVYAMGCVLWACLTGVPPPAGAHPHELRLADGRPAPDQLEALLEGMLRNDPVDRFSSLAEIGREAEWIADRL